MKKIKRVVLSTMVLVLALVMFTACSGVREVRGKTFVYERVEINCGAATDEVKSWRFIS